MNDKKKEQLMETYKENDQEIMSKLETLWIDLIEIWDSDQVLSELDPQSFGDQNLFANLLQARAQIRIAKALEDIKDYYTQ